MLGFIGLAHYFAKHGVKYDDKEALDLTHELTEAFQYYLIKASALLAGEKGQCSSFPETKYALSQMPIDHYKSEVDEIVTPEYKLNWNELRVLVKEKRSS